MTLKLYFLYDQITVHTSLACCEHTEGTLCRVQNGHLRIINSFPNIDNIVNLVFVHI